MDCDGYCADCKRISDVVIDHSSGDTICISCGLVVGHHLIDETSEWRNFAEDRENNRDPNRVGAASNPLLNGSNLSTIVVSSAPGSGGEIMATSRSKITQALINPDKGLIEGFEAITRMVDSLNLVTTIKIRAHEIYKNVVEQKSCKGKKLNAILGACLFIACREAKFPRTPKEICSVTEGVSKKEMLKAVVIIQKQVEVESGIFNPSELVNRFCSNLGLKITTVKAVQEALAKSQAIDIRRNPKSILAAIIYIITQLSDQNISLQDIAKVAEVAEGTIKKSYKDMYPNVSSLIPHWYAQDNVFNKLYPPPGFKQTNDSISRWK